MWMFSLEGWLNPLSPRGGGPKDPQLSKPLNALIQLRLGCAVVELGF